MNMIFENLHKELERLTFTYNINDPIVKNVILDDKYWMSYKKELMDLGNCFTNAAATKIKNNPEYSEIQIVKILDSEVSKPHMKIAAIISSLMTIRAQAAAFSELSDYDKKVIELYRNETAKKYVVDMEIN